MKARKFLSLVISGLLCFAQSPFVSLVAQDSSSLQSSVTRPAGLAIEARLTTYLQGGYDLAAYYNPGNSRFTFGLLGASHDISGSTKNMLFKSSDHDRLEIRLNWILSAVTRYHFTKYGEGFFAELGVGKEEFRVDADGSRFADLNAFITPAIGYTWFPWKRTGLYILPKLNGTMTLFRPDEQAGTEGTSFRLRPAFATPSIAIGWKFNFR